MIMPAYRHYADYLIKRAMSDLGSVDDFLPVPFGMIYALRISNPEISGAKRKLD
jgi:hypothetical protein